MTIFFDSIFRFPIRAIRLREPDELQLGDFGYTVQKLQETLIQLGFYDGAIDGYFSTETEQALRQAQMTFNLPVTGRCDRHTGQILQQQSAQCFSLKPPTALPTVGDRPA